MSKKRTLIIVSIGLFLSSCGSSRQDIMQQARTDCDNYGIKDGTPQYSQCLMMRDQQISGADAARRESMADTLSGMANNVRAPTVDYSAPVMAPIGPTRTCVSQVNGNQVVSSCQR